MGARGNSGVILSQIFRGFARAVEGKSSLTPRELAVAFEEAANAAYRAVNKPTEGTILTVAREAGRAAASAAGDSDASVPGVIAAAASGAKAAVLKTPSQLQILREAGVVDAGGFGLQLILEAMLKPVEEAESSNVDTTAAKPKAAQVVLDLPEGGWGYCTEFLIEGEDLDVDVIRGEIEAMGNSVLVVGEPELVKVHVHTDDPTRVITLVGRFGKILKLNVGDMSTQHKRILDSESAAGRPPRANGVGLVAVVAGSGLVEIFRGLGVDAIVEGGQTMNPSTQDMLTAVDGVPYDEVVLLPNNGNVVLAASQVAGLTKKKVHVIETHSVPQGVAAVVAFRPERSGPENVEAMKAEAARVQTIEVTHAVRDTRSNGLKVKKGDVIGLVNDKLEFAGGDYAEFFRRLAAATKLPTTSAPSPGEFAEVYRRVATEFDACISIHLGAQLSATVESARLGAQAVDGFRVEVIDSETVTMPIAFLCKVAAESESLEAATTAVRARVPKARVLALLDTLRYLEMGGRLNRAQAMIGTMLDLKPLLMVADREIKPVDRVRTRSRAISRMVDYFRGELPVEHVAVMHAQAPDEAEAIAKGLRELLPGQEIPIGKIGCVLGTHTGPKALGVVYIKK